MRKAVGYIATSLPFIVSSIAIIRQTHMLQDSISAYYYTDMRNYFVGSLCAIAMFLMACQGYDTADKIAGYCASAFALGVAFCPTLPPKWMTTCPTHLQQQLSVVHYVCATALFLTLAVFCLFLFRKTDPTQSPTPQKVQRNIVYTICGSIMVVTMAILALVDFHVFTKNPWQYTTFTGETICLLSFGYAWMTKGEAIWADQHNPSPDLS